jgi:hypothetical protein
MTHSRARLPLGGRLALGGSLALEGDFPPGGSLTLEPDFRGEVSLWGKSGSITPVPKCEYAVLSSKISNVQICTTKLLPLVEYAGKKTNAAVTRTDCTIILLLT